MNAMKHREGADRSSEIEREAHEADALLELIAVMCQLEQRDVSVSCNGSIADAAEGLTVLVDIIRGRIDMMRCICQPIAEAMATGGAR